MGRKKGSVGNNGGGRKKVENPTLIRVKVPTEEAQQALENHGTYSNAIRFAAENKPNDVLEIKTQKVLIGYLTRKIGINGYTAAKIGHKVFEEGDRFTIYLKHKILPPLRVPYYKEDLIQSINFG